MDPGVREYAAIVAARLGYGSLYEKQEDILVKFMSKCDVFGVLPTGYGKSLCFACLPWLFDKVDNESEPSSIVIVICPLTAIMLDQVANLTRRGLSSACIIGDCDEATKRGVMQGQYQLVFFSPEILLNSKAWRDLLLGPVYEKRLKALVVDEAHTVKKWGDSFRSLLLRIGEIRSLIPREANILALTATATRTLRNHVISILGMKDPHIISISPSKDNIIYHVVEFKSVVETFTPILERLQVERTSCPKMIIFCDKIKLCSTLYDFFRCGLGKHFTDPIDAPDLSKFRLVEMFSSCTPEGVKRQIIESFCTPSAPLRVVCATVAFGMGVDCPDVRQIITFGVPEDVETYIQQVGRAGRDKKTSLATLVKLPIIGKHKISSTMKDYRKNNEICRRKLLFSDIEDYVHEEKQSKCLCCDVCERDCKCKMCRDNLSSFIVL